MRTSLFVSLLFFVTVTNLHAQDITNLGGDLTSTLPGRSAIQVNAPNVVDEDRRLLQLSGFSVFHGLFSKNDGLGPRFLSDSCGGCHVNNGRGPLRFSSSKLVGTTMVLKASLPGLNSNGSPRDIPGIGQQIQDHSVGGTSGESVSLIWRDMPVGTYPDGTRYKLRRPDLRVRLNNVRISTRNLRFSLRMTPPVIGPGLLEAVPESEIEALADPTDANHDGISGRPNYVINARTTAIAIGRFGFRASNPTVEQQSCGALMNDMGVSNPLFHDPALIPELNEENLNKLAVYQRIAGVPIARNQDNPRVISGKALFQQIGCNACHQVTLTTATFTDPELSNQTFHPFTDLLLHNMGPELADKRAEFSAKGSEWKTTPLWGLGFTKTLSTVRAFFIHDGRARSVEEAILWHGGESAPSRKKFKNLTKTERGDVLRFLDSL
jgi:CxxC motif-containing protein (DUF1111 family)